ncbi:MAG: hypothetical protein NTV86_07920 [Planctomycetota bacterium]|nr:hypothetical protein [Planctomycetota bacterium]
MKQANEWAVRLEAGDTRSMPVPLFYQRLRERVVRMGDAALPALKGEFLSLSITDRANFLKDTGTRPDPYWPVLSPAGGEFLSGQLDSLPEATHRSVLMLIARCRYRPIQPRIAAAYEKGEREWYGYALFYLGDFRYVPEWASDLVDPRVIYPVYEMNNMPAEAANALSGPWYMCYERFESTVGKGKAGEVDLLAAKIDALGTDRGVPVEPERITQEAQAWRQWARSPEGVSHRVTSLAWTGEICFHQKRYEVGAICLREAIRLDPKHARAMAALARCLAEWGKGPEARAQVAAAEAMGDQFSIQVLDLAFAHRALKENEKARQALYRHVARWKGDVPVLAGLIKWEIEDGNLDKARQLAEDLRKMDGQVYRNLIQKNPILQGSTGSDSRPSVTTNPRP